MWPFHTCCLSNCCSKRNSASPSATSTSKLSRYACTPEGDSRGKLTILFPYHSHMVRDSYGSGMRIVWERSPMSLGVPENFNYMRTINLRQNLRQIFQSHGAYGVYNPQTWIYKSYVHILYLFRLELRGSVVALKIGWTIFLLLFFIFHLSQLHLLKKSSCGLWSNFHGQSCCWVNPQSLQFPSDQVEKLDDYHFEPRCDIKRTRTYSYRRTQDIPIQQFVGIFRRKFAAVSTQRKNWDSTHTYNIWSMGLVYLPTWKP